MTFTLSINAFKGLSREAQAVLGAATIISVQQVDGEARIDEVREAVDLPDDAWDAVIAELHAAGVAWLCSDPLTAAASTLQTVLTHPLCMMAPGPSARPSRPAWDALRVRVFASVFEGDEPYCIYCETPGVPLELDHVLPIARGGSNHPLNLAPACKPCNRSKGVKLYSEWRSEK